MQNFYVFLAAAMCSVALAQMNLPAPSIFIQTSGTPLNSPSPMTINGTLNNSYISVNIGSNVTIGCRHTDAQMQTTIGKWSTSTSGSADVLFPLYTNGYATNAFADLIVRYPQVDARVDGTAYLVPPTPIVNYVMLINVQPYDLGKYGCFSNFGSAKQTLYANVTLLADTADVYGVRAVSTDQQMVVTQTSTQTSYSCYVYRGLGSVTDYLLWFNKCQWSNLGQDIATQRTISCNNNASLYNTATSMQVSNNIGIITSVKAAETINADMYPAPVGSPYYNYIFWGKNLIRDSYSLSLTPTQIYAAGAAGWLNRTLGCFAYRNASGVKSDYVTFVQPNVDLFLDPTQFSCGLHNYIAQQGNLVPIYCTVTQPSYRAIGTASWEVWMPATPVGTFYPVTVASQSDVNNQKWGKFVVYVVPTTGQALVGDAQQSRLGTGLNITVDAATTLTYRYRLIVSYTDGSQSRSDFFSISTSAGSGLSGSGSLGAPQRGQVSGGAAALIASWSFALASLFALLCHRV